MKTLIVLIPALLLSWIGLFGQVSEMTTYDVVESPFRLNGVSHNAYTLSTDVDRQVAIESWTKLMADKDIPTYIVDTTQGLLLNKDVRLEQVSSSPFNIYLLPRYEAANDGTLLTFWFQNTNGQFVSSKDKPGFFPKLSKFLVDFNLQTKNQLRQDIHREGAARADWEYPPTSKIGKSELH